MATTILCSAPLGGILAILPSTAGLLVLLGSIVPSPRGREGAPRGQSRHRRPPL